jgi:hypothetical protein
MLPEAWTLLGRTSTDCMVSRNMGGRVTVWQLRLTEYGWRIMEVLFSQPNVGCNLTRERHKTYEGQCREFQGGCWDRQLHRKGQRLTDQRFHRILAEYCTGARS